MNHNFLQQIILELGPTGLLVIGLYYALIRSSDKICTRLRIINHELGEIVKFVALIADIYAQKEGKDKDGENKISLNE